MNQELILLAILDGLSYAALLFLVALGITLVFGVMNIVNMAHGSLFAIGGYAAATVGAWALASGISPLWSLIMLPLVAIVVGALCGGLMEKFLLRRIYSKDPALQLLVTFAAFMIFEDLQRMIWGTQPYSTAELVNYLGVSEVMGITYTNYQLVVLPGVALAVFFALRYFLRRSPVGRQVVAVTHHREVATAMGINVTRICFLTFIAGSALGALGGVMAVQTTSWVAGTGAEMIVLSFAVVATAGLGQIEGALVAAIMIGLARAFSVYLMPELEVLVPYLIMTLVLLVRPQGLFSVAKARRV
ncbi:branched-chain amino acid ABC transporter permease [Noviherbaspirillum galbum]|uniref:Branched-chain amino acid ABC transporter permease n=1 Tax=Noviherbaspirillum galbum TaxID=2709383 RepID=A0A6B3SMT3_9BURK|nr:branched-chain amino acid ABC transporter permease [Noviherbaspirillum galbum]NEX62170.1 branched-chain amino acid ABC transporter permease [Noviherbaspirillum galbum]